MPSKSMKSLFWQFWSYLHSRPLKSCRSYTVVDFDWSPQNPPEVNGPEYWCQMLTVPRNDAREVRWGEFYMTWRGSLTRSHDLMENSEITWPGKCAGSIAFSQEQTLLGIEHNGLVVPSTDRGELTHTYSNRISYNCKVGEWRARMVFSCSIMIKWRRYH